MFKPNNLDFNDGLAGAYTEIPNHGEMLSMFRFRANYELDIFNLNSHEESISFLIDKLGKDIEALRAHLGEVQLPRTTSIDELIEQLLLLKAQGHTDIYAYRPYPNDFDHELIGIKLVPVEIDYEHQQANPNKHLPDSVIIWDNE